MGITAEDLINPDLDVPPISCRTDLHKDDGAPDGVTAGRCSGESEPCNSSSPVTMPHEAYTPRTSNHTPGRHAFPHAPSSVYDSEAKEDCHDANGVTWTSGPLSLRSSLAPSSTSWRRDTSGLCLCADDGDDDDNEEQPVLLSCVASGRARRRASGGEAVAVANDASSLRSPSHGAAHAYHSTQLYTRHSHQRLRQDVRKGCVDSDSDLCVVAHASDMTRENRRLFTHGRTADGRAHKMSSRRYVPCEEDNGIARQCSEHTSRMTSPQVSHMALLSSPISSLSSSPWRSVMHSQGGSRAVLTNDYDREGGIVSMSLVL